MIPLVKPGGISSDSGVERGKEELNALSKNNINLQTRRINS